MLFSLILLLLALAAGAAGYRNPLDRRCAEAAFRGQWEEVPASMKGNTSGVYEFRGKHWQWLWEKPLPGCAQPRAFTPDETKECWKRKRVIFMGGSTTRQFFELEADRVEAEIWKLRCTMKQGYGCFDCLRGCRNPYYWGSKQDDWADLRTLLPYLLEFTWKPEMFQLDDLTRLRAIKADEHKKSPDAFIVHKGVHDSYNWEQQELYKFYPRALFIKEMSDRARILASSLTSMFPKAVLFWRDAYHHYLHHSSEEILVSMRDTLNDIFREAGFIIIPGYNLSRAAVRPALDGIHVDPSTVEVITNTLKSLLCPPKKSKKRS